ncbi:hypothetical protein Ahy_B04g072024 [Arachis hypogaea]|uniref:Aminotransferase-like plant mobile domain-containing protein n=1 Tax=Arachis hypogaea TaxID=3818 RepID=A0A444ZM75_ARAHY|nr:hypothetical protein Ahy_B04g072024 [Arachis hypogaea]
MAHQARNDGDINRLNETSHYARAADFEVNCVLFEASPSTVPASQPYPSSTGRHRPVAQRKESFTLKLVWFRDRVRQMSATDDPKTLRQYARCYIMLLIGGYLLIDKFNNLVHIHWLPLLRDFAECRALS